MPIGAARAGLLLPLSQALLTDPTALTSGNATSAATITTPSISPSPGALLLFCVAARDDTEAHALVSGAPTVTGLNIASAWETITESQVDTDQSRYVGIALQMAYCTSSPGSGTLRANLAGSCFNLLCAVYEVSQGFGLTLSGYPRVTNGVEDSTMALNFASAPAASSLIFNWTAMTGSPAGSYTAPSGHTAFTAVTETTNLTGKASRKLLSGAQNNSWTSLDPPDATAGIGVEVTQRA